MEKRVRYVTDAIWPVIADEMDYIRRSVKAVSDGVVRIEWGKGTTTKPVK